MRKQRKRPRADLNSIHVIRLAKQFFMLPLVLGKRAFAGVMALIQGMKSDKKVRAEDQTRQSRVRRQLRGLPPDHVSQPPKLL